MLLGTRRLQPRRQLIANGQRLPLGKRALDIISVLAEARGAIVTKDELLEAVWPGVVVEENALQVHVAALRKALGPEADRLITIRGIGYQLQTDPESVCATTEQASAESAAPESSDRLDAQPAPPPSFPAPSSSRWRPAAVLSIARSHRLALPLGALLIVLIVTWALFGAQLGLRPAGRIPVVVQALAAAGSGNPTEAALARGITDELILRLRRIPELKVATAEADGSAPSEAFGNAYLTDGNIRIDGDRLRVTVRLASASGEILWSQTFDRGVANLFDMQEEIAAAIASELSVSLDVGDNAAFGGTNNPEAYAAYMQYYANQWSPDAGVAQRYLERAVALDPHFVKGLVGLSQVYATRASLATTVAEGEAALALMDDSSKRALAADPQLAVGNAIRGWYLLMRKDMVGSDRFIRRAAALDSGNDPEVRTNLAIYGMYTGRASKAATIRQSNELIDPIYRNDPWKIFDLMMLGQYRQAVELFARLKRNDHPSLPAFQFHTYMAYLLMGDEAGAAEFARREGVPFDAAMQAVRAGAIARMPDAELKRWAEGFGGPTLMVVAAVYAGEGGYPVQALKILRWAIERPGGAQLLLMWHPALAEARRTPEFGKLVTDLGFVKMWRESGDWGDYCRPAAGGGISCR